MTSGSFFTGRILFTDVILHPYFMNATFFLDKKAIKLRKAAKRRLQVDGEQPWPYPCGLMVGFLAEYDNGDIHLQRSELSRGAWFNRHHLPQIPEKLSIARQIIDYWLDLKSKEDSNKE